MSDSKGNIVLFLGAGFSHRAGLPTMAGFGDDSYKELSGLKYGKRNQNKEAKPMLCKAGEMFQEFQNYCRNAKRYVNIDVDNMEDIFCIAESMKECGVEEIELEKRNATIDEIIEKIQLWLWKIFQRLPAVNELFRAEPYIDFFKIIRNNKFGERLKVITTNYDLVFEHFSEKSGIPCKYPNFKEQEYFSIFQENIGCFLDSGDKSPLLCKLHGSINYFLKRGERDKIWICDRIIDKRGLPDGTSLSKKQQGVPEILRLDSIKEINPKQTPDFLPGIIPPTHAKLHGYDWLKTIWKNAFKAIQNSKAIVFIGYSFPESDGFMRSLFQGAFSHRENGEEPDIYIFDPSLEKNGYLKARYRNVFKTDLKWKPYKFKDSLEELEKVFKEISDM